MSLTRETVTPTKRCNFTKVQRAAVHAAQGGLCHACGKQLGERFEIDHRVDIWLGGAHDLANWEAKHPECHSVKTAAQATVRAHIKRLIQKADPQSRKPPKMRKTGRKIPSRPFEKRK